MRRPVKPFVTEYKGPNRRTSHGVGTAQRSAGTDTGFRQAAEPLFRASETAARSSEDSYEAALRAADALFAPALERTRPAEAAPKPEPGPAASAPAAQSAESQAADANAADAARAEPPAASQGGRILRVLDEPPLFEAAGPEPEDAPKRRGRKPGSKNKPKDGVLASLGAPAAEQAKPGEAILAPHQAAPGHRPEMVAAAYDDAEDDDDGSDAEVLDEAPTPRATGGGASHGERYTWVRTKLRPWESWKRRLPKVCW